MNDILLKLADIADRAFNETITPSDKNAFYGVSVERDGIAIEARWVRSMHYRHITPWRELDGNPDVLDYAFDLVKNIVKAET
jgi:hypothetical protein